MQTPLTTRDSYHDLAISMLKGLAIVLVVMGHSEWPMWILKPIYMVHMPIFFFVSGYLLKERHFTGSLTFIKRRLRGLWFPFVLWSLVFTALHNVLCWCHLYPAGALYTLRETLERVPRIALMLTTDVDSDSILLALWFLKELLYASVISFFAIKAVNKFARHHTACLAGTTALFLVLAVALSFAPFTIPTVGPRTMLACAFYTAGHTWRKYGVTPKRPIAVSIAVLLAMVVVSELYPMNINSVGKKLFVYFIIISMSSAAAVTLSKVAAGRACRACRVLDYTGRHTLEILTFHYLAMKLVSLVKIAVYGLPLTMLETHDVVEWGSTLPWMLAYTLAGVGIPLLLCRIGLSRLR